MNLTKKDVSQRPFEYACHEGNYGMVGILLAGRAEDKAAEEAAKNGVAVHAASGRHGRRALEIRAHRALALLDRLDLGDGNRAAGVELAGQDDRFAGAAAEAGELLVRDRIHLPGADEHILRCIRRLVAEARDRALAVGNLLAVSPHPGVRRAAHAVADRTRPRLLRAAHDVGAERQPAECRRQHETLLHRSPPF